ncbi:hypothetical protein SBA4_1920001 [Candidatus Sulfopaludibacter sp. SbA4]|nr:hypothetical protein SBA4_1920001 [Candidatus Sulfopaludibacter sp. SbA4]
MSSNTQKLRVLRARTDHDLLLVVQHEMDRSFALADVVTSRNSPLFLQAEKAFQTAAALLPRISGPSPDDRLRLDAKLKTLRLALDRVPAFANLRSYPASFAS